MPGFSFSLGAYRLKGVCYARTDRGQELPVLDFTHPAFAVAAGRERDEEAEDALRAEARLFVGLASPRPDGGPGVRAVRPASWLRTYRAKLGDEGLGWARWFLFLRSADAFLVEQIRLRAHALVRLLAAGLAPALARRPGAPLHLVNVAGGAASDSLNALILLSRDHPFLLWGRAIRIHVLDADPAGPHFAARALAALRAPGAPLARLDAELDHVPYDWREPAALEGHLARWREDGAVLAGSSEGGLLEYCADDLVEEHLRLFRAGTPPGFVLACSAWRGDEPARSARGLRGRDQPLRSHTRASLAALADQAGWDVQWSQDDNPLHLVCLLRPR
jgi:hypothetical protein